MNRNFKQALISAILLALALCAASMPCAAEPAPAPRALRACLPDMEVAPFLLQGSSEPGLIERIIFEAARRTGFAVTVTRAPIKRCVFDFQQGATDVLLLAWNPGTQMMGRFPMMGDKADVERRIARVSVAWAQRKQAPLHFDGGRYLSASGRTPIVGTLRAMLVVTAPLREQGYEVEDSSFSVHQLLLQLRAQRIDAAAILMEQAQRELRGGRFDDIEILPQTINQIDYYVAVAPLTWAAAPKQIEAWWNAIAQVRDSMTVLP